MKTVISLKYLLLSVVTAGCLSVSTVQADIYTALNDYEQGNFASAKAEFERLLPLGNDMSAFNLGAMYFNGDGVERDITLAYGYFKLAAELNNPDAKEILPQVEAQLSEEMEVTAAEHYQRLVSQVKVPRGSLTASFPQTPIHQSRAVVSRVAPRFPTRAVENNQIGYVEAQILINADGSVKAVTIVDEYPRNTFSRAVSRAAQQWEYEPGDEPTLTIVRFDFGFSNGFEPARVNRFVEQYQLWSGAWQESAEHQHVLSVFFQLLNVQSAAHFRVNNDLPEAPDVIDFEKLKGIPELTFRHPQFEGHAFVELDQRGEIIQVLSSNEAAASWTDELVGMRVRGRGVEPGEYRIYRAPGLSSNNLISVQQVIEVPPAFRENHWRQRAARNGSKEAQRRLASYNPFWEQYLIAQGDAEVMAWAGARMFLNGQQQDGIALLQQSLERDYETASDMLEALQAP